MRKLATSLFRAILTVIGVVCLVTTASAQAGAFNPTHYWTYRILDQTPAPASIFVQDQFFRQGVPVTVDTRQRLLNWVEKNGSPVLDSLVHYTWWNIQEKLPVNKTVTVTNQFGAYHVQVLNLEFLLAPAWKNQTFAGAPPANHYLCYRAVGFPAPPSSYDLRDEWRVDIQHPQDMQFLCTPCLKQHLGQTYPALDTLTHLAAYPITPQSDYFFAFLSDQFQQRQHYVQQTPLEFLFVPSEKTEIPTPTDGSTWGRVRATYR